MNCSRGNVFAQWQNENETSKETMKLPDIGIP